MHDSAGTPHAKPCVWMTAGLLTYKLCDRDFECERCPLDAALRREPIDELAVPALRAPELSRAYPNDRLYAAGHLWVQPAGGAESPYLRVGIDAFAAVVMGSCRSVFCQPPDCHLQPGDLLATVDLGLGVLTVGAPVAGKAVELNPLLWHDPRLMISQPYGSGWIAHVIADSITDLDALLPAAAARDSALADLGRLRRRVATQLLAEEGEWASMANGGEMACDLRAILGGTKYLNLLQELIH